MKYEDLTQWVENEAARYAVVQEKNAKETFVKIPYDEDFDFIYHQRGYHENSLSRNQAFTTADYTTSSTAWCMTCRVR